MDRQDEQDKCKATNRCNADCVFCDRKGAAVIDGYSLKMEKDQEPGAEAYIVGIPEVDLAAAKKLATETIGVGFREREYFGDRLEDSGRR